MVSEHSLKYISAGALSGRSRIDPLRMDNSLPGQPTKRIDRESVSSSSSIRQPGSLIASTRTVYISVMSCSPRSFGEESGSRS